MTLSNSRQQFLAYESQAPEDIQYGRRGGMFISTCVCIFYVILAIIVAVLVGVIVYFITYFKVSPKPTDFWNEAEPFGEGAPPNQDLRLPSNVIPSFYRLKINANLENSTFSGDVYITISSNKNVKEIILHTKDLSINSNIKLTEQIYEKVETIHTSSKTKREAPSDQISNSTVTLENNNVTIEINNATSNTSNVLLEKLLENGSSINDTATSSPAVNTSTEIQQMENATNDVNNSVTMASEVSSTSVPVIHTQVTHSSVRNIKIISITKSTGDRLILTLASALKPYVDYTLEISFEGKILDSMTGFYKSTYVNSNHETKHLGVTQFEPVSARSAFPCFDEPAFKAKFEISIAHPENYTVLSNMKMSTQENVTDKPGWKWTHFERSVNMSTYLVAYTLTDFKYLETNYSSQDNVTKSIRVWTRPDLLSKAQYAITIVPKILEYYENVFGLPYALDKLDLIAIPDFANGAMENWGLITFRETSLLYDDASGVPRDKQTVAIDVAHELAHQWFGNLVTMRWWTDLWLNEGFATYMEYVGVQHIEPAWNMLADFFEDKMSLLRMDSLKNTSPVSRKVNDGSEISQKFDEISYHKGANLIRMLNHTITETLFYKGLQIYLNEWKYGNAEENDLWYAMSKATASDPDLKELSVSDFMNTWTKQAGYPVVNVTRNYETGEVVFTQKLFSTSRDPYARTAGQMWHVPVSYVAVPGVAGAAPHRLWLRERTATARAPGNASQALYVNVDAIGYYRVNYDLKNWRLLSDALNSGQIESHTSRAQLMDDAFNLAKVSQLEYSYALSLTTYLINGGDSKTTWEMLLNNMVFIESNLRSSSGYIYFQDYIKLLIAKKLQSLNYGLDKPKDDNEAFLVENLLSWECIAESQRCLSWARAEFEKWMNQNDSNNNPIPNHLRAVVYNVVLKTGGRREFEFLWNAFHNSTDPNVKTLIMSCLPSTRHESLITMLLEKSMTELPKQYAASVWSVSQPIGSRIGQRFLIENFDLIYEKFMDADGFLFQAVFTGPFAAITTTDELDELKSLAMKHKEKLMPLSQSIQKLVDGADLRIEWIRQHAHTCSQWFRDYVTGASKNSSDPIPPTQPAITQNVTSSAPAVLQPQGNATQANTTMPANVTVTDDNTTVPTLTTK